MSWFSREMQKVRWRAKQKYIHKFIFIHIPKTGGSSINFTLGIPREHVTAFELRGRIGAERWEKKFKFAFVRNPWDRAVSSFHFARIRNSRFVALTFSDWLQLAYVERHPLYFDLPHSFSPQFDWINDRKEDVIVDFVGRFENLQQDFATVCERIGHPVVEKLRHSNKTKHEDYRHYYRDKDVDLVAKWYKKDIEFFGYTFDPSNSAPQPIRYLNESAGIGLKQVAV